MEDYKENTRTEKFCGRSQGISVFNNQIGFMNNWHRFYWVCQAPCFR